MEWTALMPESKVPGVEVVIPYGYLFVIGLVSGLLVGLALGIAETMGSLSPRDALRSVLLGAMFGAAGGILGITFGNAFYNLMRGLTGTSPYGQQLPAGVPPEARLPSIPGPIAFLLLLIGRGLGWALIGAFIGLSQGIATSSTKKMINGAVGGFIGGGIGGSVFEILVWMNKAGAVSFAAGLIRFISFASTGAAIGLFLGFVEEVAKRAWLVRLVGTNEGKHYIIDKPVTVLGRSELVDLPVFGDPDIAERHAAIVRQGDRFYIEDLGSYSGTRVNDAVVLKEMLRDRDTIMIGKTRFMFRDKATAGSAYSPAGTYDTGPRIPLSEHVCPFCGSVKDANGNCRCVLPDAAAGLPAVQPTAQIAAQTTVRQPVDQQTAQLAAPSDSPLALPGTRTARLVAVAGPYAGRTFVLKPGETRIGRESTADIALSTDNTVSRNHARIVEEAGGYVIYDEGSTNGTFVNGARVSRRELANADVVQIGSTKLRFEM